MKRLKYLIFISIISLASSCNVEVDTLFYNSELLMTELKIDGEIIKLDSTEMFTRIKLSTGEHIIESSGILPSSVNILREGLITSGKKTFITFPIIYSDEKYENNKNMDSKSPYGPLLISDSLIIYRSNFNNQSDLKSAMKSAILNIDVQTKRFGEDFAKKFKFDLPPLRILTTHDNIIIKYKSWDYLINESPETINIREQDNIISSVFGNSRHKNILLELEDFIEMSKSTDLFRVEIIEDKTIISTFNKYINKCYK